MSLLEQEEGIHPGRATIDPLGFAEALGSIVRMDWPQVTRMRNDLRVVEPLGSD